MHLLIFALAALIGVWDGRRLWRQKRRRELAVCGVLIGASLLIGLGELLDLPSPLDVLSQWLHPVGKILFRRY